MINLGYVALALTGGPRANPGVKAGTIDALYAVEMPVIVVWAMCEGSVTGAVTY